MKNSAAPKEERLPGLNMPLLPNYVYDLGDVMLPHHNRIHTRVIQAPIPKELALANPVLAPFAGADFLCPHVDVEETLAQGTSSGSAEGVQAYAKLLRAKIVEDEVAAELLERAKKHSF